MSMIYSHYSQRHIDTDKEEVVVLPDGDVILSSDDSALMEAWEEGLIPDAEMFELGWTQKELLECPTVDKGEY